MGLGAAIGKLPGALARWVCKFLPRLTRASLPRTARASTFRKSKPRRSVSSDDAEGEASGRSRRELWKRKPGPNPRDLTIRMPTRCNSSQLPRRRSRQRAPRLPRNCRVSQRGRSRSHAVWPRGWRAEARGDGVTGATTTRASVHQGFEAASHVRIGALQGRCEGSERSCPSRRVRTAPAAGRGG